MRVYVETLIRADLGKLWQATQDPARHQRWDLRFGRIQALPGDRLRYSTLGISGTGLATHNQNPHEPISALRFGSAHPLSPIRSGAGYWRYLPTPDGIRFLTAYRYRPHVLPARLMWWATAWSFDRLRLWLETGATPERSLRQALAEAALRATAAALAALTLPLPAALAILTLAVAVPPLPTTPAARRCLRRPPRRETSCTSPTAIPRQRM